MTDLEKLIFNLLNNDDFPMIPFNKKATKDEIFLFSFFKNLNGSTLLRELLKNKEHIHLDKAIGIIKHYKSEIVYFDQNLDFDTFKKIENILTSSSRLSFKNIFITDYIETIKNNESNIDVEFLNIIKEKEFKTFVKLVTNYNLVSIKDLFIIDNFAVFDFINKHKEKYKLLKELNQPLFILQNMNGRLDIDDDTLKYFFEVCPLDLNLFKELKKSISLETIYRFSKKRVSLDFIAELVETFDEFLYFINLNQMNMKTLESFLLKTKSNYPEIYNNLNTLIVMKKGLRQ